MTGPFTPLADIPHEIESLSCYSGLYEARPALFAPRNEEELRRIFAHARKTKTKLTFRAGGHAFDAQALNADLVVLMTAFSEIRVDVAGREMTVGAGARWGAVLERLEPLGLVPYVTISTSEATCGGTLSADCLSRFSPTYGKEGHHIKRFDFMTVDGEVVTCTPPASKDPASWNLGERIFAGAIGGMGYLGAAVRITYDLLEVGETHREIGVLSTVKKYRSYRDLAKNLIPLVQAMQADDNRALASVFSGLFMTRGGRYAFVIQSSYTKALERRPMPQHQPQSFARLVVEILLRSQLLNRILWPIFFALFLSEKKTYIDDLAGYTFFMDGNVRAKDSARAWASRCASSSRPSWSRRRPSTYRGTRRRITSRPSSRRRTRGWRRRASSPPCSTCSSSRPTTSSCSRRAGGSPASR